MLLLIRVAGFVHVFQIDAYCVMLLKCAQEASLEHYDNACAAGIMLDSILVSARMTALQQGPKVCAAMHVYSTYYI
eukprot:5557336-Amphidinium_carterae.1